MFSLAGRVAVVTGGASGIGAACADLLERSDVRVARWDVGEHPDAIFCDVSDAQSVAKAMDTTLAEYGSPSLLVAAAGVSAGSMTLMEMDVATWDRILGINLRGVMLSLQAVARAAAANGAGGSMVLVSSINGIVADPGLAAYSASKAAVYHLARVAARELGSHGIRVNAVGPGPTDTPMMSAHLGQPGYREEVLRRTPLGGVGSPTLIAETIVGLLQMEWVTGQAVMADGGASLTTARSNWQVRIAD